MFNSCTPATVLVLGELGRGEESRCVKSRIECVKSCLFEKGLLFIYALRMVSS